MMTTWRCPGCHAQIGPGLETCPSCGVGLQGPGAERLWRVDGQIRELQRQRTLLIAELAGPGPDPASEPSGVAAGWSPESATPSSSRPGWGGQQLLLGLGALLLLSAAAVFGFVVWFVIGPVGQALVLAATTVAAAVSAGAAARRGLHAVATTCAALTTGLVLVLAAALPVLGVAGLDGLPGDVYWTGALLAVALALAGVWSTLPSGAVDASEDEAESADAGGNARTLLVTSASAAAALAGWTALAVLDPSGVAAVAAFGLLAMVAAGVALLLPEPMTGTPYATWPWWASSACAGLGFLATGLAVGYDPGGPVADRYLAAALLALVPAGLGWAAGRPGERVDAGDGQTQPGSLRASLAVLSAVPVLGIGLVDLPAPALALLTVVAALGVVGLPRLGVLPAVWQRPIAGTLAAALPVLFTGAWVLGLTGSDSLRLTGGDVVDRVLGEALDRAADPSLAWVWVAGLAWLAVSVDRSVRSHAEVRVGWVVSAHAAAAVTWLATWTLLDEVSSSEVLTVAAPMTALSLVLAILAAQAAGRGGRWTGVEPVSLLAALAYGMVALAAAADVSATATAVVLWGAGAIVLAHAAAPGRLTGGYVGSVLVSAGTWVLLADRAVDTVELYSAPLALALAALGAVQWRRVPTLPTWMTLGPALVAALSPSLVVALVDGGAVRLAGVTAAAIAVLLLGAAQRWRAPVTIGSVVLVVVAVTQGGPWIAYVPGWVTLGAGGAVLLAAGLAWERALLTGRAATGWYAALR